MNRHVLDFLNTSEAYRRGWVDARTYLDALHRATVSLASAANELRLEADVLQLRTRTLEVGRG